MTGEQQPRPDPGAGRPAFPAVHHTGRPAFPVFALDVPVIDASDARTEAARAIEPLCMLWCIPGFRSNDWAHAFKLLR